MDGFKNPYISRVRIKNFRNFLNADVALDHKQVIIGENNIGKTNFLRAIQLVLDKSFSDNDKQLLESDFHESLADPMVNGEKIEIILNVKGYEHNSKLVSQFDDAVVEVAPPTLEFRYHFFPNIDQSGNILSYSYDTYKGRDNRVKFTSEDRNFINIYVIKALRDVERELKASRNSPLYKLVKQYDIQKEELEDIAALMKDAADKILKLDEIGHIKQTIQERFATLSGLQTDNEINLRTFDIDMDRLLYSIQVYMGIKERPVAELSLGLANILYISLMLILLKDRTIQPILKGEKYDDLDEDDLTGIMRDAYAITDNGNYLLNSDLTEQQIDNLYQHMDQSNLVSVQSFTILAVEEPESHLHPVLQRLIYREVLHKSNTSVIFTSHSTFITAVAPLSSIVHIRRNEGASKVYSTANLDMPEQETEDIERYLDAKRGEIYFGKGVILAEGITEEYIVPAAAALKGTSLDDMGIIVCNIHSTNFKPYVQILEALHIPWVLFTDGDYYEINENDEVKPNTEETDEEEEEEDGEAEDEEVEEGAKKKKPKRIYHIMETGREKYLKGHEIIAKLLLSLKILNKSEVPDTIDERNELFKENGCFVGYYTLEVDILNMNVQEIDDIFNKIYDELSGKGPKAKANFARFLEETDYWTALSRIEGNISKGRFAQRLSRQMIEEMIPAYISNGIDYIIEKVRTDHE
jgi:putative ATP-dependent endonuclease of OLD family